jgi:succinate dehydrogenase / fumarate reductase, iron-sulfur subunit
MRGAEGPVHGGPALTAPMERRRALLVLGAGAVAAGGGLGFLLAGCGSSAPVGPVWVTVGIDASDLPVGEPVEVPLSVIVDAQTIDISTWLVRGEDGTLTAFDPRCTHATCGYRWSPDSRQFDCLCHQAAFAVDGTVLYGPPPRPLDRWALRETDGVLEVEVTGSIEPPRDA